MARPLGSISTNIEPKRLKRLLALEKERRGVAEDKLVFVGIANLASYYWCAMHSVLKSRADEAMFFGAYLADRIRYSKELGLIRSLPRTDAELLRVGEEITFEDVEKLLAKRPVASSDVSLDAYSFGDSNGGMQMVINPNVSAERRKSLESDARRNKLKITDLEKVPIVRGNMMHWNNPEKYRSIRWNFQAGVYVIVGVPDGITDDSVYEYKTTKSDFLAGFVKPVAFAQADLYGHFFRRSKKRVQIQVIETSKTQTWEEPIDETRVGTLVHDFAQVDAGKLFPHPPKSWKCARCEICGFGKLCQKQQ
ncbi:MAG TPA: hypothetical protein VFL98_02260 [Candidatus Paceibacterota bacterium]|nr:hypothetical protein [Candidatus Paceibacterota bacterium]